MNSYKLNFSWRHKGLRTENIPLKQRQIVSKESCFLDFSFTARHYEFTIFITTDIKVTAKGIKMAKIENSLDVTMVRITIIYRNLP